MAVDKKNREEYERDLLKKEAALKAIEEVRSGMIIGLGTGSTVRFALEEMGRRITAGLLKGIKGIPSSSETERLARKFGIPLTGFSGQKCIDLDIDGADEVDPNLNLIKGWGGALLREKILAQASRRTIIIVDDSKVSGVLGEKRRVPVEVLPFSWEAEDEYLSTRCRGTALRQRRPGRPFITEQGNYIIDCDFGGISDPAGLAARLSGRAAIMEHGLFVGLTNEVIIAGKGGTRILNRDDGGDNKECET